MSEKYPLPSYAASIHRAGDQLVLTLPPSEESERGHTVFIPLDKCEVATNSFGAPLASQRGFAVLLEVLKQRERSGRASKIGAKGAEPRRLLEGAVESDPKYKAWMKAMNEDKAEKAAASAFLRGLGL